MNRLLVAILACSLSAAALAGIVALRDGPVAPAEEAVHHRPVGAMARLLSEPSMAGDPHHTGMERPHFAPAEGKVPSAAEAERLDEVHHLVIRSDGEFNPEGGVRGGKGTLDDPYLITGYYVTGDLYIADTDACFIVAENYIRGQLTLNWNGQCTHVHHNFIGDLRVNENVPRSGYATGGLLELNKISYIGQIRHYDGEFRHNEVGPFVASDIWDTVLETVPFGFARDPRVANVDGFNQGYFHHNTFYGSVDLDFHGHHHGTGFFAPHSHYHGEDMEKMSDHDHDHTKRWTSVAFTDNLVVDPDGYGLRYEDQNHAGDDRRANSEDLEVLNEDHMHRTFIEIARNEIQGSGLWVDVFNADDENHHERNDGWLVIEDNKVTVQEKSQDLPFGFFGPGFAANAGIHVFAAKEADIRITGNEVIFVPSDDEPSPLEALDAFGWWRRDLEAVGIDVYHVLDANITIVNNAVTDFVYGVRAMHLDADVHWTVADNRFAGVAHEVWWDDSVANPPS